MLRIAITGSRGLIGSAIVDRLRRDGARVRRFVSGAYTPIDDGTEWVAWNPSESLPDGALDGIDAVIHLAGASIARLWTKSHKQAIRESRIGPTRHLAMAVERDGVPLLLSGSAVGIYGSRGDQIITEESPRGKDFLADIAADWEAAAQCRARVINLRTSQVLSRRGGLLGVQLLPFRLGLGTVLGDGSQYIPWISITDYVEAIALLLRSNFSGPINLSTPQPVTNRIFGRTFAQVLRRPFLFTAPGFLLRQLPGGMADALLASQRVLPARLQSLGFAFQFPELEPAIRHELAKP